MHQPGDPLSLTQAVAAAIESLLFVAGRPVEIAELRKLLEIDEERLRVGIELLENQCAEQRRGIRLQRVGEQVQLVSAPEYARYVAAFLGMPMQVKLTNAALETLAIIAYRQPITRGQLESIRGVNCDRALQTLVQYSLVQEVGRATTVGRPALFGTTSEFLQQFGLGSLQALPAAEPAPEILQQRLLDATAIRDAVGSDDPIGASQT